MRTTNKLEIHVKRVPDKQNNARDKEGRTYKVSLANIDMTLPLQITTSNGTQRMMVDKKGIMVKSATPLIIDDDIDYLTKIVLE